MNLQEAVPRWKEQLSLQAAYLNHVPFVVLRAISDKADNSATMDYPTFEKAAARHCANLVKEMVKAL